MIIYHDRDIIALPNKMGNKTLFFRMVFLFLLERVTDNFVELLLVCQVLNFNLLTKEFTYA